MTKGVTISRSSYRAPAEWWSACQAIPAWREVFRSKCRPPLVRPRDGLPKRRRARCKPRRTAANKEYETMHVAESLVGRVGGGREVGAVVDALTPSFSVALGRPRSEMTCEVCVMSSVHGRIDPQHRNQRLKGGGRGGGTSKMCLGCGRRRCVQGATWLFKLVRDVTLYTILYVYDYYVTTTRNRLPPPRPQLLEPAALPPPPPTTALVSEATVLPALPATAATAAPSCRAAL